MFRRINYFLTYFFQFPAYTSHFLLIIICLSVIICFKLRFSRSIVRCCMWYIFYSGTKISIHSHIVCYLCRPKYLLIGILNVHAIIRGENGFKVVFFPHRDCNTKYINIWYDTKLKLEFFSLVLFHISLF